MFSFIVTLAVGIICITLGASNMRGNIESLHSYHRQRVTEEDRLPFGRLVGAGTITVGVGIIIFSILSTITLYTENNAFIIVGTVLMITAIIVGLAISFYAMKKYNGGIF